jgi:hypothetical protein
MPEIFNPNPVIFASSKTSNRKIHVEKGLWLGENDDPILDDLDEVEPIDQDEIFGQSMSAYLGRENFTSML